MERVHIDFLGPLPKTAAGNEHILMMVDQFTKIGRNHPPAIADCGSDCPCGSERVFYKVWLSILPILRLGQELRKQAVRCYVRGFANTEDKDYTI